MPSPLRGSGLLELTAKPEIGSSAGLPCRPARRPLRRCGWPFRLRRCTVHPAGFVHKRLRCTVHRSRRCVGRRRRKGYIWRRPHRRHRPCGQTGRRTDDRSRRRVRSRLREECRSRRDRGRAGFRRAAQKQRAGRRLRDTGPRARGRGVVSCSRPAGRRGARHGRGATAPSAGTWSAARG